VRASFARLKLAERCSPAGEGTRPYVSRGLVSDRDKTEDFSSSCASPKAISMHNAFVTFYRRNLPHLQRDYKPHFITFVTKNRRTLTDWARHIVLDCCMHDHEARYNLRVVVVMPDHVHMILTPLTDENRRLIFPLPEIMKAIKGTSSHAINQRFRRHETIWQEESFDHVLRSAESLDAKIDYILQNPVRAGLVRVASEYPWSWRKPVESPYSLVVNF